jgi:glucose-1-phosphate adenylyltransferase
LNSPGCGADYWRDVGTIDAYYDANLELTAPEPQLDLYDPNWSIYTYQPQLPPAKFIDHGPGGGCHMNDAMASGGCIVSNSVINDSLLFSNVKIENECRLDGVLVLPECTIGRGSRITHAILDNGCQVPPGTVIGENPDLDAGLYHRTEGGVVVVNRAMLGQERQYQPSMVFTS